MSNPPCIRAQQRPRLSRRRALHAALLLLTGCATPAARQPTPTVQSPATSHSVLIPAPPPEPTAFPTFTVAPTAVPAPTRVPTPVPSTPAATPVAAPTAPVPSATSVPTAAPLLFEGQRAWEHAAAQLQWVPRDSGTAGWQQCGDYILNQLTAQGWSTEAQPFLYQGVNCRNLIGRRGSGPVLIIGAHYDARRRADSDPDPALASAAVPAANDGASGIAVLLELARVLRPEVLGREIWLVAFDAEDNGGLDGWEYIAGSTYMAANLAVIPQGVVVVDMIGDADQQLYYEVNSFQAQAPMKAALWQTAAELGFASFVAEPRWSMLDDHTPFLQRGIPAIDIIDFDYPYWHTTQDTLDKVSPASLAAVGRTVQEWLERGAPGLPPPPQALRPWIPGPHQSSSGCCGRHRSAEQVQARLAARQNRIADKSFKA